ncbi:MAG: hypothetical protein ACRD13_07035, partial [Terriglobales bacterium]
AWDFSVMAAPAQTTVPRGTNTAQFTLASAGVAGFTGAIGLSCAPAPPLTCAFSPATINAGASSVLTVSGLAQATGNAVPVTVSATSGSDTHTVPLTVAISDFSLAVANPSATIGAGQTASYTLTVAPLEGWTGSIALTCSGAPRGAACVITPATISLAGSSQTATVSVTTTAAGGIAAPPTDGGAPWETGGLILLALGLAAALATGRRRLSAALACGLLGCCLAACGGTGNQPPVRLSTPRGSATLTVTAAAGSLVHTLPLTLDVN